MVDNHQHKVHHAFVTTITETKSLECQITLLQELELEILINKFISNIT